MNEAETRAKFINLPPVMAGLVPAIHAAPLRRHWRWGRDVAALLLALLDVTAWMAGTRPAMTAEEDIGSRQGRAA